ncbi:MAG: hypothetical protein ACE5EE_06540 [Fidelibacterota bacterium]
MIVRLIRDIYILGIMRLHLPLFGVLLGIFMVSCVNNPYESDASQAVDPVSNIGFAYLQHDSALFVAADLRTFYSGAGIGEVKMIWYAKSGFSLTTPDSVLLYDSGFQGDILAGDRRYSRKVALSALSNGLTYGDTGTVYLKITAVYGAVNFTQADSFSLGNIMPKIDSLIVPDTLNRPASGFNLDTLRVQVSDPDGRDDVKWVAYKSLKPDSTYANNGDYIYLYDDGGEVILYQSDLLTLTSGDEVKEDGTYAYVIVYDNSTPAGTYIWTFYAQDWSSNFSIGVMKTVVVQ